MPVAGIGIEVMFIMCLLKCHLGTGWILLAFGWWVPWEFADGWPLGHHPGRPSSAYIAVRLFVRKASGSVVILDNRFGELSSLAWSSGKENRIWFSSHSTV